jgi:hypothetical protein
VAVRGVALLRGVGLLYLLARTYFWEGQEEKILRS